MKKMTNQDQLLEKVKLFNKMKNGNASTHDLVYMSFLRGMISKEEYDDFKEIEKDFS